MSSSSLNISPRTTPVTIGNVTLDAAITQSHKSTNDLTEHPVEEGVDITDHIRHKPDEIEVHGVVSNNPILWLATLNQTSPVYGDTGFPSPTDRARIAHSYFKMVMAQGQLLSVVTQLASYKNMAIVSYTVSRDEKSGNILDFTVGLKELVIVSTALVQTPSPANPANGSVQDEGSQTSSEAPEDLNSQLDEKVTGRLPGQYGPLK